MSTAPLTGVRRRTGVTALTLAAAAMSLLVGLHMLAPYLHRTGPQLWHPHLGWLAVSVSVELVSFAALSELQRTVLRTAGTVIRARSMLRLTFESNALSRTVPGGSALAAQHSYRRLRAWGASTPSVAYTMIASGVVSTVAFAALAAFASAVAGADVAGPTPLVVAAAALACLLVTVDQVRRRPSATVRRMERLLRMVERARRRAHPHAHATLTGLVDAVANIRHSRRDWSASLIYASVNWIADLTCLIAACHAVGAGATTIALAALAYVAGMSVTSLTTTPGGLGIVDTAMILTLTHGGVHPTAAVAAVLLYRFISYVLVAAAGWFLWFASRRHHPGLRHRTSSRPFRLRVISPLKQGEHRVAA